ncbi:gamma-glutamyltransferase family protein [Lichenihabitans sp. PAMC28606]|uniref:gamma-glutamyltransferase family protein n=1 Tax=Lichenihabitans sp. PAMC28606 TaxID=2880932 RepID=UPI001D0AC6E4|nr:gamma-glutamyltransferase family protein [Lichenihabitans sp. PAMC28606]UDL93746.1 gamma-glutamyltransferase family protein [Lichenihabitans sp. PAMC28606]
MRDYEKPGRSLVMARHGMAATSHSSASLAAVNMLQAGGNAIDAAIAACAVQCVVEPGSTGIGGDCFALISPDGSDRIVAYNGSGRAPAAATTDWYKQQGFTTIPRQSPHAVTVPGAVEAWARLLHDHGTRGLGEVLAPAVALARDGYAVSSRVGRDWINQEALLRADPDAARIFLPDGHAPKIGTVHRQPELAATLEAIGQDGPDAFYKGQRAADMVAHLRKLGGLHSAEDFASARGTYEMPIKTRFRGHDIFECPPGGQGVIALMILNILSGFEGRGDPLSPDRLHIEIEATKLAYSIRDAVLADPAKADVPIDWLLSDTLAAELRSRIDLTSCLDDIPAFLPPDHKDTVYICVVDKNRMAVSFINSIFHPFGSGIVEPNSGVLFHNRGQSFVVEAGHPNAIAPGKRPLHTIIPGMMTREGRVEMPFGVMGGHYQAMGHAHFVSKLLDYGLNMQAAIDLPRLFPKPGTRDVEAEATLPAATRIELERRGFRIVPPSWAIGGAQAISIDWDTGVLIGASDHRKDGAALGY